MTLSDTQLTAQAVLDAFDKDAPLLFLGAAFVTTGLVSIGFCALRRRFDDLLVWMGLFAAVYGLRLWMQADVLRIAIPGNEILNRLRWAIDFLVPVPAFTFFRVAGFLGRPEKIKRAVWAVNALFLIMFAATLAIGPVKMFYGINALIVTSLLVAMLIRNIRNRKGDLEFRVVRKGVMFFLVWSLWDNTGGKHWPPAHMEPYGFAVLLGCLGFVAARRTVRRDVELGEIQSELELAKRIQLSILPEAFPEAASFRVAARYVPMTSVAGDLYDYLVAGDGKVGLLIADVSGHGVPAALIASMVKMAATSQRPLAARPAELLAGMNAALCGNTQGQYVTAAYAYLDAAAGELRYAAAGHPAMLLLRNGAVSEIAENGLLLAATTLAQYADITIKIMAGDRMMLYTDGLLEARNGEGALFGEAALMDALKGTAGLPPEAAADQVIAAVQRWTKTQDDDLTLLVCDFAGAA